MIKTVATLLLTLLLADPLIAKPNNPPRIQDSKPKTQPSSQSSLDKFKSCKEANAAGMSNVPVSIGYTPPGWRRSADANKDGIACDKK